MLRPFMFVKVLATCVVACFCGCGPNTPPDANAGGNRTVSCNETVVLDGTSSTGTNLVSFSWSALTAGVELEDAGSAIASFMATKDGSFTFELTVENDMGVTDSETVQITVEPCVVANAGRDDTVSCGDDVDLDGSQSSGSSLSFMWSVQGDFDVTLDDPTAVSPRFIAPDLVDRTLRVDLLVSDPSGNTASDFVEITIDTPCQPPPPPPCDAPCSSSSECGSLVCDEDDGCCVLCIVDEDCGEGLSCNSDGQCETDDLCDGVDCPSGQSCNATTGDCETDDLCDGVNCPAGQSCNATTGDCEGSPPDPCDGVNCPAGQSCITSTGNCEGSPPDPCTGVNCPAGQSCNPSTGQCQTDDPCDGINCPAGQSCNPATGVCENDPGPCDGVVCPGQVCNEANGLCVDCVDDEDCSGSEACDANMCVEPCIVGDTLYVDCGATDNGMGCSWDLPFNNLHDALAAATTEDIWVKLGTCSTGSNESDSFVINKSLSLYGGFVGTETGTAQRGHAARTVLSGASTSFHVVSIPDSSTVTARIDGFEIKDGVADGPSGSTDGSRNGGGVWVKGMAGAFHNVVIARCNVTNNQAQGRGAGVWFTRASVTLEDTELNSNSANGSDSGGGAVYLDDGAPLGSLTIKRCKLTGNHATLSGAAVGCGGAASIFNTLISDNDAGSQRGGAINHFGDGSFIMYNATVVGNVSTSDNGGINFPNTNTCSGASEIKIINSILWDNDGTLTNGTANLRIGSGCVNSDNTTVDYSCIGDDNEDDVLPSHVGPWSTDYDPQMINLRPQPGSPCIDSGDNGSTDGSADLDGSPRIQNGAVDMGAYEYTP